MLARVIGNISNITRCIWLMNVELKCMVFIWTKHTMFTFEYIQQGDYVLHEIK